MSRSSHSHTLTNSYTVVEQPAVSLAGDALSQPANDNLVSGALAMWPTGAAWGSPDGEAVQVDTLLGRFTRVLVDLFAWLYARSWQLVQESSAQTVSETLEEWEADYGLPEACFTGERSRVQRITALQRKVAAEPVNHPEDFIRLAAEYGFTIEIEEPCIAECGFSECGGKHECGSYLDETYIVVRVKDAAIDYFECGVSEVSVDPLFSLGEAEQILCMIRKLAPGWVTVVADDWITLAVLVTEAGNPIIDEYGNRLLVRV